MAYKKSPSNKPLGTIGNTSIAKGCWYRYINGLVNEAGMAILDLTDGEFCKTMKLPVLQYDIVETDEQGVETTTTHLVPKYYYSAQKMTLTFMRVEHIQTSTGMGYVILNDDDFELLLLDNVYYDFDFEDTNITKINVGGGSIDSQYYGFFCVAPIRETEIPDEATNIVEVDLNALPDTPDTPVPPVQP